MKKLLFNLDSARCCLKYGGFAVIGMLLLFSCNRDFPNLLNKNNTIDTSFSNKPRKVLYVILDGVRGTVAKNVSPNISNMADNAIYTWNGMADFDTTFKLINANGWANMLTGVYDSKSKVTTDDFAGNNLAAYPSILTRLKQTRPNLRTAALGSSAALKNNLFADATAAQLLSSDADVQNAALAELKNKDAGVVVVQFHGADAVGTQYGYDTTVAQYKTAINTLDGYVAALVGALGGRPTVANENWLVIVASNKGGVSALPADDVTLYGDARRNSFVFFYNPVFQQSYVPKPSSTKGAGVWSGTTPKLYGNPTNSTGGANIIIQKTGDPTPSILDPGQGPYTFEAKIKIYPQSGSSYSYSNSGGMPFLAKARYRYNGDYSGNNSGWALYRSGNDITFWMRSDGLASGTRTGKDMFNLSTQIVDSAWHTIAFTLLKDGTTFYATAYLDGLPSGTGTLTGIPSGDGISSTNPLKLGYNDNIFGGTNYINMSVADVRVWKAAIPADVMLQYSCLPGLPPKTHPYYSSLVGFWSCTGGSGTQSTITDQTGSGRNGTITIGAPGTIQWKGFSEISNNICPDPNSDYYKKVPNSVDIPFQIYQWLGVNIPTSWGLDGRAWLTGYTNLVNPSN